MNIENFLNKLKQFIEELEAVVHKIINNASQGMSDIPKVMEDISELLPDWFLFIEKTGVGDKREIIEALSEVVAGMEREDCVCLTDALFYGVRELMIEYKNVIEEALNGE